MVSAFFFGHLLPDFRTDERSTALIIETDLHWLRESSSGTRGRILPGANMSPARAARPEATEIHGAARWSDLSRESRSSQNSDKAGQGRGSNDSPRGRWASLHRKMIG